MEKIALITGAAGGLGRALAAELAAEGWRLIVVSRDAGRLAEAFGTEHLQIEADCSSVAGVHKVFEVAAGHQMVAGAPAHRGGNNRAGSVHRMAEADFDDCLRANLISAFHTLGGFVGALRSARRPGAAVLVSSAAAQVGTPNPEDGAAAKAREGEKEGCVA